MAVQDVIEINWKEWLYNEIEEGIKYVEREDSDDD